MTDHDRGAYTPQTDAPLAFDARRARGAGGPAPMTLIVSAVILLLLIIALLLFYRSGVRGAGQAPQVVGAPVGQTKSPPASAEPAASSAGAGLQIYNSENPPPGEAKAPTFAPAPEQPTLRAAPPPPAAIPAPTSPVASAPLRPAQTEAAPAAPAPTPAPVAKVLPAPAPSSAAAERLAPAISAKPAAPKPASVAPAKARPTPVAKPAHAVVAHEASAPVAGEPVVQIGAFSSARLAEKGWNDTALVLPGKMTGKSSKVEKTERDGKTFYRAYVAGFASHADAVSFCVSLKAAGKNCMVR